MFRFIIAATGLLFLSACVSLELVSSAENAKMPVLLGPVQPRVSLPVVEQFDASSKMGVSVTQSDIQTMVTTQFQDRGALGRSMNEHLYRDSFYMEVEELELSGYATCLIFCMEIKEKVNAEVSVHGR